MARYGRLIGALVLLGMTGFAGIGVGTAAEACSARYIKMIVANPPGGVGDLIARTVAEGASTELKQSVVVENRAGASTVLGTGFVAQAETDGGTRASLAVSACGVCWR